MSALMTCTSAMREERFLLAALERLGVNPDKIRIGQEGGQLVAMRPYASVELRVHIAISKADYHQGYGDVGFRRSADGTYEVLVDDSDNVGTLCRSGNVTGTSWTGRLQQWYAAEASMRALRNEGLSPKVVAEGEKLVIRAA